MRQKRSERLRRRICVATFLQLLIVSSSAGPAIEKARADLIARTQAASEKLKWYGITAESLAEFVNGVIRSAAKRLWP